MQLVSLLNCEGFKQLAFHHIPQHKHSKFASPKLGKGSCSLSRIPLERSWSAQGFYPGKKPTVDRTPIIAMSASATSDISASDALVLGELQPSGVGLLTINRPKALNAADMNMVEEMRQILKDFGSDPNCKCVVLGSSSSRALCSGGDVKAIVQALQQERGGPRDQAQLLGAKALAAEYNLICEIANFRKPFISFMDGITMGFGLGVSGHGRYRVVTETSLMAMPENVIGLLPDVGFALLAAKAPGSLGLYMALTGAKIGDPVDLMYMGLGTHFVTSSNLAKLKEDLLSADFSGDADAFEVVRTCLAEHAEDAPHAVGSHALISLQPHIDRCFMDKPNVQAILEALQVEGCGEEVEGWSPGEVARALMSGSPTSLAATHHHFTAVQAAHDAHTPCPIEEVLRTEHRVCVHLIYDSPDFCEGVRAALIDKDKKPKWSPTTIEEVQNTDTLFCKLCDEKEAFFIGDS